MKEAYPKQDEVENIARLARLNLAKDGYLSQVAFLWTGQQIAIVGGRGLYNSTDKQAWAATLRRMAIEFKADTVLSIIEVWAAHPPRDHKPEDLLGPVQDKSGAYEAVLFQLETMDGTWTCVVPIIRSDGQGPAFPMPRYWSQGSVSGTMTNLIPDKKASAYTKS